MQKTFRRHRTSVLAAGAVVLALVLGLCLSTWQYLAKSRAEATQRHLREEADGARSNEAAARRAAEIQELAARKKAYSSDMKLVQLALADGDNARAQDLLDHQRPALGQEDLRGWEWRYFWQFCRGDPAILLTQRSNSVQAVSFSADGGLLAVGTQDHELTVWDAFTDRSPAAGT
jgi:hypothetical protein